MEMVVHFTLHLQIKKERLYFYGCTFTSRDQKRTVVLLRSIDWSNGNGCTFYIASIDQIKMEVLLRSIDWSNGNGCTFYIASREQIRIVVLLRSINVKYEWLRMVVFTFHL